MHLIVGLGNPGRKYKRTRHNAGFMAVDEIAANFQFPVFGFKSIFNVQISKGDIGGKKVAIVKPQTFMNNSGKAVRQLIKNLKLENKNLIVVHDDIDLRLGEFKISKDKGSAGHKGVQSVIDELGTKEFNRVRIGICPESGKPENVEDFVLKKFSRNEEKTIKKVIDKAVQAAQNDLL